MDSSQPLPRNSSTVCPVIQRHSAESSSISPSGEVTQVICAPPCTRARYRSSLRRSASSVAGPAVPAMTISPAPDSAPSGRWTPNQWKIRWPGCALPLAAPGAKVSIAGRPWVSTCCSATSARAASTAGQTSATGRPAKSATGRPNSSASAELTQTNRMSVPRTAIPADASRKTASGSQDSNSVNPASRCFGTEVSALNEHLAHHAGACHWRLLPALPCQPRHTSLPGA